MSLFGPFCHCFLVRFHCFVFMLLFLLIFSLILFSLQASIGLLSMHTYLPRRILYVNRHNGHHPITHFSSTLSHSSSFNVSTIPTTSSLITDNHNVDIHPFMPGILEDRSLHLTSWSQHVLTLFVSSPQASTLNLLMLFIFHIPTSAPICLSDCLSYSKLCLHTPGWEVVLSFSR